MQTELLASIPDARARRLLTIAWIPHWALLAGQLAHGLSWVLLADLALRGGLGFSFPGLAWVHLVALGWLTLISLAVLVHVLHGWLEITWIAPAVVRWSLLPFALGNWGLVAGFWLGRMDVVAVAGGVTGAALAVYLALALASFFSFKPDSDVTWRVARAFLLVLSLLGATAALGVAMAWALGGMALPAWVLAVGPALHAHLGGIGWLTLLVMGVSTHTVKPITGGRSRAVWLHVIASSGMVLGLSALAVGLAGGAREWLAVGVGLAAVAAIAYLVDMGDVLKRARVTHRPPQAFLAAASLYLVGAVALGAGVWSGRADWQGAYAFLALAGWLGQMVNGHLYHIGIRVLATVARGEDDETRPHELLAAPLSWASFIAFQAAIVGGTAGLLAQSGPLVAAAAIAGGLGWATMGANILHAWRRANTRG